MMKRISALIAAFVLFACSVPLVFAQQMPSLSSKGSIRIHMEWEEEKLNDGALSIYRVCDIVKRNGQYQFEPIDELKKYNLNLDSMSESEKAKKLAELAKSEKLQRFTSPVQNGEAFFANLSTGLYVVTQDKDEATDGFEPINPFLISVPKFENGGYDLHVEAHPKVSLQPEETTPPETEPPEPTQPPKIPQTGQMNWPVPIMAVSGLMLIAAGVLILTNGRKDSDEEHNR